MTYELPGRRCRPATLLASRKVAKTEPGHTKGKKIRDLRRVDRPPGWRENDASGHAGNRSIGTGRRRKEHTRRLSNGYRREKEMDTTRGWR